MQESMPVDGGVTVENGGVNGSVSLLQKRILDLIGQNPHITAAAIADQIGTPRRTIENNLKKLKERGTISRVGSDKTGNWVILEPCQINISKFSRVQTFANFGG